MSKLFSPLWQISINSSALPLKSRQKHKIALWSAWQTNSRGSSVGPKVGFGDLQSLVQFDRWSLTASDNYRIFDRKSTIAEIFAEPITFHFHHSSGWPIAELSPFKRVTSNEKSDRTIKPAAAAIAMTIAFSDHAIKCTKPQRCMVLQQGVFSVTIHRLLCFVPSVVLRFVFFWFCQLVVGMQHRERKKGVITKVRRAERGPA